MAWQEQLKGNPLPWLLEKSEPGMRYLALRDLVGLSADDPELKAARKLAHAQGPIAAILDHMAPAGYWAEAGPGYLPKYRATVWAIILLAQLGASIAEDERIARGCSYLLEHALTPMGQFSTSGTPGGTVDCLQGNLLWALSELCWRDPANALAQTARTNAGCWRDPRLEGAYEWMARSLTGEGVVSLEDKHAAPLARGADASLRYYAGKCGPDFACGANNQLPCAWGAAKVMLAFGRLPAERRTPLVEGAIQRGLDFLFSVDLASAAYPAGYSDRPSGNWWKFGFPVFYVTDLLQVVEALVGLGCASDPCLPEERRENLSRALALVRDKQDDAGRWALEYDYAGKTWVDFGPKKQPNKWVTLRALRVLKQV
jgi:hypothetical protein